jgi:hypothetical protein
LSHISSRKEDFAQLSFAKGMASRRNFSSLTVSPNNLAAVLFSLSKASLVAFNAPGSTGLLTSSCRRWASFAEILSCPTSSICAQDALENRLPKTTTATAAQTERRCDIFTPILKTS